MQNFQDSIIDKNTGRPIAGATVDVYDAGTSNHATIYVDDGITQKNNPFTVGDDGEIEFYAANGKYDVRVAGTTTDGYGITPETKTVNLFDSTEDVTFTRVVSLNGFIGNITGDVASAGISTFSNANTKIQNGVFMADQYDGADASVKINAAITAALAVNGGVVDARGLSGAQTISQQINIGATGKPVTLLLPPSGTWTVTISNGTSSAFKLYDGSAVAGGTSGNNGLKVKMGIGASVASVITNDQTGLMQCKIQGFMVYQSNIGTVANAVVDLSNLEANSIIRDMNISTFSGIGLWIHGKNSVIAVINCWVDGSSTSGARPLVIETTSDSCQSVSFFGGAIEHPGATNYVVEINGNGAANLANIYFNGTHFEGNSTDGSTPFVRIVDAKCIQFSGNLFNSTVGGSTAYAVQIAQTGTGLTRSVVLSSVLCSTAKAVDDTIASTTVQKSYINFYNYGQGNTDHDWVEFNGNTFDPTTAASLPRGVALGGGTPITKIVVYSENCTPSTVSTATIAEQTFTVSGLVPSDKIIVNPPAIANATGIAGARVSGTDTMAIRFINPTSGSLVPTAGTYVVIALRS